MKLLLALVMAALQDSSAPGAAPAPAPLPLQAPPVAATIPEEPSPAPSAPPYEGTLTQGMRELRQHARAGEYEQALALADGLLAAEAVGSWRTRVESATSGWSEGVLSHLEGPLEWLGVEMRTSAERAEVHYARGFVLHELARREESRESFGKARMLAGPGPTRLDAVYDLGTSALLEGEEWRAKIPEISGVQNAPAPGAPPAGAGPQPPGAPPAEDPLALAKAAYLGAREYLLERLRSDWEDADSRANAELVMRRLRELEQIEKQRQEQQQQQQQQQEDQKKDSQQNQGQDPKQGDQQKPDEPKDPKPDEKQEKPPEPMQDESQPGEPPKDEPSKDETGQPEEHELTKEEVQRLLDKLAEHEKEGEEVHQRLQRLRRVPVKRDW